MDNRMLVAVLGAAVLVTTVLAAGATEANSRDRDSERAGSAGGTEVAAADGSDGAHGDAGDGRDAGGGGDQGGPPGPPLTSGRYVVGFEGDPAEARRAVDGAGGQVVDVNNRLDLALVAAPDDGFVERVRGEANVIGAARNHAVGTTAPGMPHRFAVERPSAAERAAATAPDAPPGPAVPAPTAEPLADRQWDMAMIGAGSGAHQRATGRGVRVGIIDTGIDATHPDLAPNVDVAASRNFTADIPAIDGPCEEEGCIDAAPGDDNGHGTHVAGVVAAAVNGLGIAGVAPDATLVDLRAGQDSGYFFLWETVSALTYAAEAGIDVVNMSFYVDPWLYNCGSADDYVSGRPSVSELAEQRLTREMVTAALGLARSFGVSLVSSAGNQHLDLAAPMRADGSSPDHPAGAARPRTVTNACPTLPAEGEGVLAVSAVGPSGAKADYSNHGLGKVALSAPGGWLKDLYGTPGHGSIGNAVLSTYPLDVAIAEGLATPEGHPVDAASVRSCDAAGACGFYTYLQGTSMAAPHVAGVAALVVEARGVGNDRSGYVLAPDMVRSTLTATARDLPCPPGGVEDYTQEGSPPEWNAICVGDPDRNSFHGEGLVDATAAVA